MKNHERDTGVPGSDLVCVFRTGDEGLVAIGKSILEGEGIQYIARNAELQDLFGVGRIGGSFNFVIGSVDFLVSPGDAERARALLDALRQGFLSGGAAESDDSREV
jgi:Putative prokaryotic signal transducing protein